jgi:small redox-active disulfide protein 2
MNPRLPSIFDGVVTMAVKIEVYTSTCGTCKKLEQVVHEAVAEMKIDVEIVKLQDGISARERGVTQAPAFFVNGKLVLEGRVPLIQETIDIIMDAINDISYA